MIAKAARPLSAGPKLLDRLADALHRRNYAPALVHAYVEWVRRYIYFHDVRHPAELGMPEVSGYLEYLGVKIKGDRHCAKKLGKGGSDVGNITETFSGILRVANPVW